MTNTDRVAGGESFPPRACATTSPLRRASGLTIGRAILFAGSVGSAMPAAPAPAPVNPRHLASLSQRWIWKGPAEGVDLSDGVAYVRGKGRVTAIRAETGAVLWDTPCAQGEDLMGEGPVVVGDALAVSFAEDLFLVDRNTGRIRRALQVGIVHTIVASPLFVVAAGANDRVDLLRIDAGSGEVLARREVGGIVFDLRVSNDVAIAIVGHASSGPGTADDDELLVGYHGDSLSEVWRESYRGDPDLHAIDGALYAAVLDGPDDDAQEVFLRVNPATGALGPPLPQRMKSEVSGGLTWELELVGTGQEGSARLRRNSLDTGRPIWEVQLPGDPLAWVRVGEALYLHCDHEGGRGYLIVLDWASGATKQAAYGLRDVRGFFSHHDSIVAWRNDGLVAFAAHAFGPPEQRGIREEVDAILEGVVATDFSMQQQIQAAVTDLKTLGPRALPFIAESIPRIGAPALVAAARVLGDSGFRAAAPALAARLSDPPPPASTKWDRWDPAVDLLTTLALIGGPGTVGPVASILDESTRAGSTRFQAFATLASIGTPDALHAIDRALSQTRAATRWWQPASPEGFLQYFSRPGLDGLKEAAIAREDWVEVGRIDAATQGARVPLPEGGALFVFHDSRLGGANDVWVAEADPAGRLVSPARFVGEPAPGPIRVSVDAGSLVIEGARSAVSRHVELAELLRDSDEDGLPDVVERRLRTDPSQRDTDGDGLIDSEDPAPNGAALPRSEDETIVHSIFQQFFTFESEDGPELAIMISESPLQWIGRSGPTITLTPAQDSQLIEEAGLDGIAHISIEPGRHHMGKSGTEPEADTSDPPDERQYKLTSYRGGLNAVGYDISVRKLGGRWLIKACKLAWVS